MATIKSYTDIEQSRKLAEFLPIESADMFYRENGIDAKLMWEHNAQKVENPCWSLAALLDVLDYEIVDEEGVSYFLNFYKEDNQYKLCYRYELDTIGEDDIWTDSYDDFLDACYEMIIKLYEKDLL